MTSKDYCRGTNLLAGKLIHLGYRLGINEEQVGINYDNLNKFIENTSSVGANKVSIITREGRLNQISKIYATLEYLFEEFGMIFDLTAFYVAGFDYYDYGTGNDKREKAVNRVKKDLLQLLHDNIFQHRSNIPIRSISLHNNEPTDISLRSYVEIARKVGEWVIKLKETGYPDPMWNKIEKYLVVNAKDRVFIVYFFNIYGLWVQKNVPHENRSNLLSVESHIARELDIKGTGNKITTRITLSKNNVISRNVFQMRTEWVD